MIKSYVYFVSNGTHIKIGKANNPRGRIHTLNTSSSVELNTLGVIELTSEKEALTKEKELHTYFKEFNSSGEWFNIDLNSILEYLGTSLLETPTIVVDRYTIPQEVIEEPMSTEGYSNLGMLYTALVKSKTPPNLIPVAMAFGEWSIGKLRQTTDTTSISVHNRTLTQWARLIGIGKSTLVNHLKKLTELGIIKVHKGSNYRQDGGSYPDYYSIVFDKELQIKHKLFFNVSGISKQKFTTLEELEASIPKATSGEENIKRQRKINKLAKEYNLS